MAILLNNTLTMDIGRHTAIAHWEGKRYPYTFEMSVPKKIHKAEEFLAYQQDQFESYIDCQKNIAGKQIHLAYIEAVEYWEGNMTSRTAAVRGDLALLSYLLGVYFAVCQSNNIEVRLMSARAWKGNLDKDATVERVKRINGMTYTSEHITDAVAFGFSRVPEVWKLKEKV
jgi:hypothetical protein